MDLETNKAVTSAGRHRRFLSWGLAGLIALLSAGVFTQAARWHARTHNTIFEAWDQSAYQHSAEKLVASDYQHMVGRNRMPAYIYLLSLVYDPSLNDHQNWYWGKRFSIRLALACAIGVAGICFWTLPVRAAAAVSLVSTFTIFMFRAGYTQAEPLYYALLFAAFVASCRLLLRPQWLTAIAAGALIGLSYLTKAGVLPMLAMLALSAVVSSSVSLWRSRGQSRTRSTRTAAALSAASTMAKTATCVATFFLVVSPYILTNKRVFGSYFYNVNSTFYIWYDSWADAEQGTKAYGDRQQYPDMPPELIPGPRRYLETHTLAQIGLRLSSGFAEIAVAAVYDTGWTKYLLLYAVSTAVFGLAAWKRGAIRRTACSDGNSHFAGGVGVALFALLFVIGYLTLTAFYMAITSPPRFIMALVTPTLFALAWALALPAIRRQTLSVDGLSLRPDHVHLLVLVLLPVDLTLNLIPSLPTFTGQ